MRCFKPGLKAKTRLENIERWCKAAGHPEAKNKISCRCGHGGKKEATK